MIGYEDFSSYSTGSLPGNITQISANADADISVETLAGSISGQALRVIKTGGTANQGECVTFDDISIQDGDVAMLFSFDPGAPSPVDWPGSAHLFARISGAYDFVGVYVETNLEHIEGLYGDDESTFLNEGRIQNTGAIGSQQTQNMTGKERWWVRFNFNGSAYKIKYWLYDDPEPAAWNVEASQVSAPTASGLLGASIGENSTTNQNWLEFVGWSDDPSCPAPLEPVPLEQSHDTSQTWEGVTGFSFSHGDLTNGLVVIRMTGSMPDPTPTVNGSNTKVAISDAGLGVSIAYLEVGNLSAASMSIAGVPLGSKGVVSVYNGADQTEALLDASETFVDTPAAGQWGGTVDSDDEGYLVLDVINDTAGNTPSTTQECKIFRADDLGAGVGVHLTAGDIYSVTAATHMWYTATASQTMVIASFAKALPTYTVAFNAPSEHLAKIQALLNVPTEHLRVIVEEILNRKRLWVEVGQDVRTLETDI